MFKLIKGLPDDVLGIEAHGRVTHEDYIDNLIPLFDEKLKWHDRIRVLYVIQPDFEGYELAALWDDATYGMIHWSDVSHIAVVCDEPQWVKGMSALFAPFFPGEVRSYDLVELDQAKKWVEEPESLAA